MMVEGETLQMNSWDTPGIRFTISHNNIFFIYIIFRTIKVSSERHRLVRNLVYTVYRKKILL